MQRTAIEPASLYDALRIKKKSAPEQIIDEIDQKLSELVNGIIKCSSKELLVIGSKADALLTKYRKKIHESNIRRTILRMDNYTNEWIYPQINERKSVSLFLDCSRNGDELLSALEHLKLNGFTVNQLFVLLMSNNVKSEIISRGYLNESQIINGFPIMDQSNCSIQGEYTLLYCRFLDDSHKLEIPYLLYRTDSIDVIEFVENEFDLIVHDLIGSECVNTYATNFHPTNDRVLGFCAYTTNFSNLERKLGTSVLLGSLKPEAATITLRENRNNQTISIIVETEFDTAFNQKFSVTSSSHSIYAEIIEESGRIVGYSKTGPETKYSNAILSLIKTKIENATSDRGMKLNLERSHRVSFQTSISSLIEEQDLFDFISKHPEEFLKNARVISPSDTTFLRQIDLLLLDDNDILWILEAKAHLSEGNLTQALYHYDWIVLNIKSVLMELRKYNDIKSISKIGIILVAPAFSASILQTTKYLKMPIRLVKFTAFKDTEGKVKIVTGDYNSVVKPPPIDTTLVLMTYLLTSMGVDPSLEKIGMQLQGIYSPNDLYDEAISLSHKGMLYTGMTPKNEHGLQLTDEAYNFASELYYLYWGQLKKLIERKRGMAFENHSHK